MALPAEFLDELRARTPLAAVIGRRVRLARSGRQWKGCCPFHGEKTPSFHVYQDHFHCFGCGAHGDAISFVMQSQGAAFPEAVAQLAAEAGLEVPRATPEAAAAERRRADLHQVLEAAAAAFQRRLALPEGRAALDYLRGRGLAEATIRDFGLGWSGDGRGGLVAELGRQGIDAAQLEAGGLLKPAEPEAGPAREFFFGRVLFPIRDRQGRMIGFGGRLLGEGQPKYLNGPETALFSKRRSLYGLDRARTALRDGATLIVVEGYMDVIALHQAGFAGAVAPLGTALTEEQLAELWRLSDAPVLCFDGDRAGGAAARRAAELALPLLAPSRTLRIAALPSGEDPDSFLGRRGAPAMQATLAAALPLSAALYAMLQDGAPRTTPEQRAGFRQALEQAAGRIGDRALAAEYRRTLLDQFYAERRGPRAAAAAPRPLARPTPSAGGAAAERARILTALLLAHPRLLPDVEEAFRGLDLPAPLARLRNGMFAWADAPDTLDSPGLIDHLTRIGLGEEVGRVLAAAPVPLPFRTGETVEPADVEAGWWHFFGLMSGIDRLDAEVAQAVRDLSAGRDPTEEGHGTGGPDPGAGSGVSAGWDERAQRRLIALRAAREALVSDEPRQ